MNISVYRQTTFSLVLASEQDKALRSFNPKEPKSFGSYVVDLKQNKKTPRLAKSRYFDVTQHAHYACNFTSEVFVTSSLLSLSLIRKKIQIFLSSSFFNISTTPSFFFSFFSH
ncbi:MAG: hypothetical protein ACI90V_006598 [Bacillariaceae sp.]|jgi:hypothetical protein